MKKKTLYDPNFKQQQQQEFLKRKKTIEFYNENNKEEVTSGISFSWYFFPLYIFLLLFLLLLFSISLCWGMFYIYFLMCGAHKKNVRGRDTVWWNNYYSWIFQQNFLLKSFFDCLSFYLWSLSELIRIILSTLIHFGNAICNFFFTFQSRWELSNFCNPSGVNTYTNY